MGLLLLTYARKSSVSQCLSLGEKAYSDLLLYLRYKRTDANFLPPNLQKLTQDIGWHSPEPGPR